jgi:hypothetical protein
MNEIKRTQQQTLSYRFRDGINEMVLGIALVLAGSVFFWAARDGSNGMRYVAMLTMFSSGFLSMLLIRFLKNRITYPRSGIVHYPKPRTSFKERFAINGLVVVLISATGRYWHNARVWGQPLAELVIAGLCVVLAIHIAVNALRWHMPRLLAIAAAILAASFFYLLADGDELVGMSLLMVIPGITSVLTGGFALFSYLKRYPKNAEETL